jgi:hypothetical protein
MEVRREKPKNKEKAIDIIQNYIDKKIEQSKDNVTPSPLRMVDRKLLIPEVEELFWLFASGSDFVAITPQVLAVTETINKIEDEKIRNSNLQFIGSFDQKINPNIETDEEFKKKDNL